MYSRKPMALEAMIHCSFTYANLNNNGCFLSNDHGTSWTAVDTGLTDTSIMAFAVSGENLFAGTSGAGVFLSTNNGNNWVRSGLTKGYVCAFALSGTNLFAGIVGGVFLSTNNDTSWTAVDSGLTDTSILALVVSGTSLFAGTYRSGVWQRPLAEMITSVHPSLAELPKEFSLEQNYPNPFNPSTTIRYTLPTRSWVTLKVYDILGREVATLVNDMESPGYKSVSFVAKALPTGAYSYRLRAEGYSQVRIFLFLK